MSADGKVVVGYSFSQNGEREAFRWTLKDGMQGLGGLRDPKRPGPRISSEAKAVSDDGAVIVGSSLAGSTKAFRWTKAGGMQDLGALPGQYAASFAVGISGDGSTIVGQSSSNLGKEAFRWTTAGGMQGIGSLAGKGKPSSASAISADGKTIVGSSESSNGLVAFRWTEAASMQRLGDATASQFQPARVSEDGSIVVGTGRNADRDDEAVKWTTGGLESLGDLPGGAFYSSASAISRDGSTIVGASQSAATTEAVRWTKEGGIQSIRQLLIDSGVDMTGWELSGAADVSADGTVIVGYGTNPNKNFEGWRVDLSNRPDAK